MVKVNEGERRKAITQRSVATRLLSRIGLRTGRLALAMLALAFACRAQQSSEQLYKDATAAYDRGEVARAISLYEQAVKLQPDSVAARTDLGVALVHEGRYSEGIAEYQEALKRDPGNVTVKLDLALAWYKQGDFEKAASELREMREKQPENRQSLHLLADCYLRMGKNGDVVTLLEPSYKADPADLAVDYALGTALIRGGQIQQGELVIDRILKKGDSAEANLLMGEAQFEARDYKSAAAVLRKALDLNSGIAEAWSLYGRALLHNEDSPGAKEAFLRALQLDPNDFQSEYPPRQPVAKRRKPERGSSVCGTGSATAAVFAGSAFSRRGTRCVVGQIGRSAEEVRRTGTGLAGFSGSARAVGSGVRAHEPEAGKRARTGHGSETQRKGARGEPG